MKTNKYLKKTMLVVATIAMVFTSLFNVSPTHASSENIFFEVNKADEVINEAKRHIGKPYIWGAGGPNSFDCSGYLSYVFKQVGLKFNADRFTTNTLEAFFDGMNVTNYRYSTNEASPANAKRGDIIFYYDSTGDPMHMGLYMGDGNIIHCAASMPSGPQNQVMISPVDALGNKHGTSIVSYKVYRVFPESGGVRLQKTDEFGNTLAGVKFQINFPGEEPLFVTTNSNGYWDSDEVGIDFEAGTYSYQEVSTIEGYVLDSTPKSFTVTAGVKAQGNVVYITNKEPSAQIKVIKINTNNDRVANTAFNVYARENITNKAGTKVHYTKEQLVTTVMTSQNGEAITRHLPLGKYKVIETQVPDKYVLNSTVFNVDVLYKDQVTSIVSSSITISNKEQLGKLILKKGFDTSLVDEKVGDAYLEGNQYSLFAKERIQNAEGTITYYEKDQLVANKSTTAEGMIEWDNLPLGKYYIEEIQNNGSLQLNSQIIDVDIAYAGQTVEKTVVSKNTTNKLNMQKIKVFKSGLGNDAGIYNGLANVEFTFKLKSDVDTLGWDNAIVYDVITTDKNGNATTKYLPFGVYHVKETKTPEDYTPAPDFSITISKNYTSYPSEEQIKKINVNNVPLEAQVRLVKVDFDTGKTVTLNSASFKVKDAKGNYVVQKVGGIKIDTFTTNSDNQIVTVFGNKGEVILPLKLRAGEYSIEEIKTPQGFLELEEPIKFTIKNIHDMDMDEDQEPVVTVKVKNKQPLGELIITKSDKETGNPLMEVEYELRAKKDIINAIDGTILFKENQLVSKGTTDSLGKIIVSDLFMGHYELKETLTNDGYVLSNKVHDVVFTQNDTVTKEYEVAINVTNIAPIGRIEIVKSDKDTKETLSGVVYQLRALEDIYSLDGRNTLLYEKDAPVSKDISEDGYYMSNELGEIIIDQLPLGKYQLKEVSTLDGYVTDKNEYTIDLTYDDSEKILYVESLSFTNEKTTIELSKVDITNDKELVGASMMLKDSEGKIIEEWVSSDTPHIMRGLEVGKEYTLMEDLAPLGYVKAESITFKVEDTNEIQKVVMKDEVIKVEVSKQDFTTGDELAGATLQIIDENDKVIHEWTTDGKPTLFERLPAGVYTLKEFSAPSGYEIAEPITFTVSETTDIQKVVMQDKRKPLEDVPTGDTTVRGLYFGLLAITGGAIWCLKKRKPKK